MFIIGFSTLYLNNTPSPAINHPQSRFMTLGFPPLGMSRTEIYDGDFLKPRFHEKNKPIRESLIITMTISGNSIITIFTVYLNVSTVV